MKPQKINHKRVAYLISHGKTVRVCWKNTRRYMRYLAYMRGRPDIRRIDRKRVRNRYIPPEPDALWERIWEAIQNRQ